MASLSRNVQKVIAFATVAYSIYKFVNFLKGQNESDSDKKNKTLKDITPLKSKASTLSSELTDFTSAAMDIGIKKLKSLNSQLKNNNQDAKA